MMPTNLKASLTIQIYDCPRPTFDATITACDRPLYDYLASQPTPERAWQKAERMRIVGDVERARDQAVIDCEASRFPTPAPAPEGLQITLVTKGVMPPARPAPKGLTAVVRIDIAPQPPCPAIPFLVLVAGAGFRPRMLWQGGRMAFIAPASANSLSRQITLAFDQLLDHAVWYDTDLAAPWELRQRHAPFDLTKQRIATQGDAAHDHFHVAIVYEEMGGAGRYQYDRTLTPNQDRWTLTDARTGAIGLTETTFDIPVPDNISGSWRQRVILWRFDRGPTPASVTYDNHPVVSGNSHIWAFDDDEWRETRQKVMEIVREIVVPRMLRAEHPAVWRVRELIFPPCPFPHTAYFMHFKYLCASSSTGVDYSFDYLHEVSGPMRTRYGVPIQLDLRDAMAAGTDGSYVLFAKWNGSVRSGDSEEYFNWWVAADTASFVTAGYDNIRCITPYRPVIYMQTNEVERLTANSDIFEANF